MPDRLIRGRYRIDGLLSEGGVARISNAVDLVTGRRVIIKESIADDTSARQALISEYEFIRLHPHPSIITAYSLAADKDQACIVMPFIDGHDLKSRLSGKIIRPDEEEPGGAILELILASMLECAAFIHFCGYLYNDFKPDNFLIVESSAPAGEDSMRPVLLDFNLVCGRGEQPPRRGTLAYISPEVLKGEAPSVASDLYSLGATMFELLSGRPPHVSDDSDELIKLVSEAASIDHSAVPSPYRDGLASLLSPHPGKRPVSAREAALALGLETRFDELRKERLACYLTAGAPPFADELVKAVKDYLKSMSSRPLLVRGMSHNEAAWNYVDSRLEVEGWNVYRIGACDDEELRSTALRTFEQTAPKDNPDESILLADDLEFLTEDDIKKLKVIIRSGRNIPIILGAKRWVCTDLSCHLFDPLKDSTIKCATARSLKALLKESVPETNLEVLSEITGGDPELVFLFVLEMISKGDYISFSDFQADKIPVPGGSIPGLDQALERMYSLLKGKGREVMERLSVWGFRIPLLLLVDLDKDQQAEVNRLVESGFLILEKDAVAFSSGAVAKLLYSRIPKKKRLSYHRYWAEIAEKRLEDQLERLEMMAVHWGRSDDKARGFRVNTEAAIDFLRGGRLSKARNYAETALELAKKGGGSISVPLSVSADISRTQGDYSDARKKYVKLLSILEKEKDSGLKAKSLRELGDIYRSLKEVRKAVSYTRRALHLYKRLSDNQGVADCYNSIGLANWVAERYPQALESFESAAEINRRLGNHRELAKIDSNKGIIKDMMGRTGEVKNHFLTALENARKAGDDRLQALISNNLGFFLIRQGEFEESREHLRAALELSEQIGYTEEMINSLTNLGLCYLRLGDLFESVEYNQRARELAISFGNKQLAADAELNLTEACILMGNYGLADTVLSSIESSDTYKDDRTLKAQADLLRSRWLSSLGDFAGAVEIAARVSAAAEESANKRLKLEADIAAAEAVRMSSRERALSRLEAIVEECTELGHSDLFASAGLLMSELYFDSGDQFSAQAWIEKILSTPDLPARIFIQVSILSAEMLFKKGQFDAAIERLREMENLAAERGLVLLALRSSVILGEILVECRKYRQADDVYKKAQEYREKIVSALPENVSADSILGEPLLVRLSSGLAGIENRSLLKI